MCGPMGYILRRGGGGQIHPVQFTAIVLKLIMISDHDQALASGWIDPDPLMRTDQNVLGPVPPGVYPGSGWPASRSGNSEQLLA